MKPQSWDYQDVATGRVAVDFAEHLLVAVRKLTAVLDVEGVCDAVLSGVESVFRATASWIMLHDPESDVLRTAGCRGRAEQAFADLEIPTSRGVVGHVFTNRQIQFVPDAREEQAWFDVQRVEASGLQSIFVLPLIRADKPIGVLGLESPGFGPGAPPTPGDVKWLEVFAGQAAIGVVNARMYESSQQDRARLRALLRERRALRQQVVDLREQVRNAYSFGPIVGESAAIRQVLADLEQVAGSDITVLLLGETGTGKELLARALHERSSRAQRTFVPVNCAALPEHLVESEMFGHERGSFTGAHARKAGRFELAHRGTLFLDEIGDLPLNAQAKLLRVLQDGEVHRVGSIQPIKVDVRIVAATNHDLSTCVADRTFREDLFYRLSVFPIRIPPLRDRADDIPLLAMHLAGQFATRLGKRIQGLAEDALAPLQSYHWPGNVRELQNVMERAVILARDGVIAAEHITLHRTVAPAEPPPTGTAHAAAPGPDGATFPTLADAERTAIIHALRQAEGRVSGRAGAAAILGLKPTTLHAKMKKLGVRRRDALLGSVD
jgi:formate hydrogenlyase transcriptional activator